MSEQDPYRIQTAALSWDEKGEPTSDAFGDIYFSTASGLLESRHVFLQHNQLTERFGRLQSHDVFIIGETGFGSGLNFLVAWELFLQTAPSDAHLHFVSAEKYPLTPQDLSRALSLWPEVSHLSTELISVYPHLVTPGFYRMTLGQGRIHLTLIINDAATGFAQLLASDHPLYKDSGIKIDAWFLDGFAPSKNPQMWSNELFDNISYLSSADTTAATFSAAGIVKQGLRRAGFRIQKVPGFGRKREMVKGFFDPESSETTSNAITTQTQLAIEREALARFKSSMPYTPAWAIGDKPTQNFLSKKVMIIGAGLSGCHTARALAERGWEVTLLDSADNIAAGASGNPQGILYAKLSHKAEVQALFNETALQFSLQFYRELWPHIGQQCGVLHLANDEKEQELHGALHSKYAHAKKLVEFVDGAQASELIGSATAFSGIFFKEAGWIDPRALCELLVEHPRIRMKNNCRVQALEKEESEWKLRTSTGDLFAPNVVIANAENSDLFSQTADYPLKKIRGQITYFPADNNNPQLKTVVCAQGYIAPHRKGMWSTGATFNLRNTSLELTPQDHQINLNHLVETLPQFTDYLDKISMTEFSGRAAFRCSLPDYLPMVGPVADTPEMVNRFDKLRKNSRTPIHVKGVYLKGLYVNIGQGSRGLAYAPLTAELLASQMNNEPLPVSRELANALNPARFILRDIIRNKR